jgi:hypothetical protein
MIVFVRVGVLIRCVLWSSLIAVLITVSIGDPGQDVDRCRVDNVATWR